MNKPNTNEEALSLVLEIIGSKTALAKRLGVTKQLVSRWEEVPPPYLEKVSSISRLPLDWVLPELNSDVSRLLGRPAAPILPDLIRLIYPLQKASPQYRELKSKRKR